MPIVLLALLLTSPGSPAECDAESAIRSGKVALKAPPSSGMYVQFVMGPTNWAQLLLLMPKYGLEDYSAIRREVAAASEFYYLVLRQRGTPRFEVPKPGEVGEDGSVPVVTSVPGVVFVSFVDARTCSVISSHSPR